MARDFAHHIALRGTGICGLVRSHVPAHRAVQVYRSASYAIDGLARDDGRKNIAPMGPDFENIAKSPKVCRGFGRWAVLPALGH